MRPFVVVLFIASVGMSSALVLPGGETADDSVSGAAGDIGAIIPADRRIDWMHNTGVPGGIPEWTRICATVDAATYGGGASDATAAIQAAVNSCATSAPGTNPGPGVIAIPAGTYRLDGSVNIDKSYTVIRGAGADQTTFVAGGQAFSIGVNGVAFKNIAITAGATKGSTALTLADISDLAVGQLIAISADNEPGLVFASRNSTHDAKQMALITAIDRNTISVTPPLLWSYSPNPVLLYSFVGINRFVGLEDMKVDHAQGRSGASFMIDQCYGCWVRGMFSVKPGSYHTYVLDSLMGEIRDSYFLDSQTYGSDNAGLNVRGTTNGGMNQGAVTGFTFENNIFDKTFPGIELQNASSGNYVGYNYGYATQAGDREPGDTYVAWNTGMFNDNHGPHDMMNLWEGNSGEQFTSDGYFGSASHGTLFRNHFTGLNPRFQIAWNAISLNRWSYHYNVVGNVLGSLSPRAATYQFGDTASCYAGKGIYRLGFPNMGNCGLTSFDGANPPGIDTTVIATLLRWGNFDTQHSGAVWDAAEIPAGVPVPATQLLPASIYYDRNPSWWPAAVAWPPIGPDVMGGELVSGQAWKIPAQRCYESQNLGEGGAFSRATCYGQAEAPGDRIYLPMMMKAATLPLPQVTARPTVSASATVTVRATGTISPTGTVSPTATTMGVPVVPPADAASARLVVPEGFAVRIFASGLQEPRLMTTGPDGALYVASRGGATILRLADADNDGLADANQVVASGMNGPHNLEWHGGAFYVAENDKVSRLTDLDTDGAFTGAGERVTVTSNIPSGSGHTSRTVHIGPDGKLYVAAGSSSNNTLETDKRRATILRFNLDGSIPADNPFADDPTESRRPVWAEGLRNSVDFLFLPDGRLWADHNGSDGLGNDAPPEEIVIQVERGQHYGWPFCYTSSLGVTPAGSHEVRDVRVALAAPISSCDQVTPALFTDAAHQAPLGMTRYDKTQFPAAFRDSLLVAYHGSWNADQTPRDCRVQQIVVNDGQPVEARPFLTGFRDSPTQECGSAWGRPAGVAVGAQGEVFVSDDKNGNIYRIVYVGQ